MSATDWYVCPECRKKALTYIDKWDAEINKQYGKVELKVWENLVKCKILLGTYRKAWDDENTDFQQPKDAIKLFTFLEEQFNDEFEYCEIDGNEGTLATVRYDSDTGLGGDGILRMNECYDCDCCDFHIEVNKSWKNGTNQEYKEKDK